MCMYMLHTYVNIKVRQITCYLADISMARISVNKYELIGCQRKTEMWNFNPALFGENNIALCIFEK